MKPKLKLLWLQSISCNGNAHSFLNHPELFTLLESFELIYHPILDSTNTLEEVYSSDLKCDILVLEGSFKERGFTKFDKEVYTTVNSYANRAKWVITAGTCATFGGVFKEADVDHISGLVFNNEIKRENFNNYKDKLISIPGCPIHPKWLGFVLDMIAKEKPILLDDMLRPKELFASTVHQGCSRNEYFEWKVDTKGFGEKEGCLFYELGCQAPYTKGSCNKILWHEVSSKTNIGTPCFGCTEPTFPRATLFETPTNMGIPKKVPLGVGKRAYLTVTGIAKGFRIDRLEGKLIDYKTIDKN